MIFLFGMTAFPQDNAWDVSEQRPLGDTIKHGFIAGGETLLSNGFVMIMNGPVGGNGWGWPTQESIWINFTTPWEWEDSDGFKVNQFGHPIQGALYQSAGRVNGFGFYESALFSALGSATFEIFGEANLASINDLITTVFGSMSLGEILYRLYLEACAAGVPAPIAFFINPMAGFHRLLAGWKPPGTGRNLYRFQSCLGVAYAISSYSSSYSKQDKYSFKGFFPDIGFKIVYGNPFDQDTQVPFRHFEAAASFGWTPDQHNDIRIVTDGYLFSFSPINTGKDSISTGLTLHFDVVSIGKPDFMAHPKDTATIHQYNNALDWTLKYQHIFSDNAAMQIKYHAGFTFFGVSDYYPPNIEDHNIMNYGPGINSKLFVNLNLNKRSVLELSGFYYMNWIYPWSSSELSNVNVWWLFLDLSYSHFITKQMSLGIAGMFAMERGTFSGYPDVYKYNKTAKLFVAWNM